MDGLSLELTNTCPRQCLHCLRNKADPPGFLSLTLAREVLLQAKALGITNICLTGGEITLYPHLEELLDLVLRLNFRLSLVTSGYSFRDRLFPLLKPFPHRGRVEVCFSLDGSQAEIHDALRGPGSFREVIEAAALCHLQEIPFGLKTIITCFNQDDLLQVALLGASLGARTHGFLHPFPTPRLVKERLLPAPEELRRLIDRIAQGWGKVLKNKVIIEGYGPKTPLFSCANIMRDVNLDYQGNLILCCNLSHVVREEGQASLLGAEFLGDLKEISLTTGVIRHFRVLARLMEARLREAEVLTDLTFIPCYWCLRHFGKLDWLKAFPQSPWALGVL